MKLYLSSYRVPVPESLYNLFNKPINQLKGGIIINAGERRSVEDRKAKLEKLKADLDDIGLGDNDTIDLLSYKNPRELFISLEKYNYLYVAGGNSFDLADSIRRSGFDTLLPKLLSLGQVYIGESAGALICGPSLRGFNSMDENFLTDVEGIYEGLGIIDTIIVPHNDSPDPRFRGRYKDIKAKNPGYNVQALNDNQALVINGDKVSIVKA